MLTQQVLWTVVSPQGVLLAPATRISCMQGCYEGLVGAQDARLAAQSNVHGVNQWPAQSAAFDQSLRGHISSCLLLGQALMRGKPAESPSADNLCIATI